MAPKRKRKPPAIKCDEIQGERFHAPTEAVFDHNWWDVFCFPYILCGRFWDCFVSLCSGTNQCLVYWMMIQWIVCKITKLTTPDAIIFPYYFYMFCQVILLTLFFVLLWVWFGKSVLIPYLEVFYQAFTGELSLATPNVSRLSFRRYCFRKSEIFDTAIDNSSSFVHGYQNYLFIFFVEFIIHDVFIYLLVILFYTSGCYRIHLLTYTKS